MTVIITKRGGGGSQREEEELDLSDQDARRRHTFFQTHLTLSHDFRQHGDYRPGPEDIISLWGGPRIESVAQMDEELFDVAAAAAYPQQHDEHLPHTDEIVLAKEVYDPKTGMKRFMCR